MRRRIASAATGTSAAMDIDLTVAVPEGRFALPCWLSYSCRQSRRDLLVGDLRTMPLVSSCQQWVERHLVGDAVESELADAADATGGMRNTVGGRNEKARRSGTREARGESL
jgi:hypothetical protein